MDSHTSRTERLVDRYACWCCDQKKPAKDFSYVEPSRNYGVCSECLKRSGLPKPAAWIILPNVWGQKASRLQRALLIYLNLRRVGYVR